MWWMYALLSAFFASMTAILAKLGMDKVDSNVATAIRTVVVGLVAWGLVLSQGNLSRLRELTAENWTFLILSGIATGLSWLCYFRALQGGPVSRVAPVDKLSVALTILLSVLILKETLTLKAAAGAALIIAGTILLLL